MACRCRAQRRLGLLGHHLAEHAATPRAPPRPVELAAVAAATTTRPRRTTVNAAEHVWLGVTDTRYEDFPFRTDKPHSTLPQRPLEQLLWQMKVKSTAFFYSPFFGKFGITLRPS